jgi:tetratricopeptide (TPR) repeat protein
MMRLARFRMLMSSFLALLLVGFVPLLATRAQEPPPQPAQPASPGIPADLDDLPALFVPQIPLSTDQRAQIELTKLYMKARAFEDRGRFTDAVRTLEEALKLEPASSAILRRLGRLSEGLGRIDQAVAYYRRALDSNPNDATSLIALIRHYMGRRGDSRATEILLTKLIANPALDRRGAARLVALRELADIYSEALPQPEKAVDLLSELVEALDDRAVANLTPFELRLILRGDEAESYTAFGQTLLKAGKPLLAIRAFERGLLYAEDHPQLPRLLAEAQLRAGQTQESLQTIENFLKRKPQGREPYELLAEILKTLNREAEILPRLEAAVKENPANISLLFALAERYRAANQAARADELLKNLLAENPEPQVYGALAMSLLKERKLPELVKVLGDASTRQGGIEAIRPVVDALMADPDLAGQFVTAAIDLQKAEPPQLTEPASRITLFLARRTNQTERLIELEQLILHSEPNAGLFRELAIDLGNIGRYEEAAATMTAMFEKYPAERNLPNLASLAFYLFRAGKHEQALDAAREAQKRDPNEQQVLQMIGILLSRLGRDEEAIAHYKDLLKRFPNDDEIIRRARAGLSAIYAELAKFDLAEKELEILLEQFPDDPGINNDLGYLYADQGKNLEKAELMIRKAIEDEPENSSYLDSLGWVLFKLGKPRDALEYLEKASKDPNIDATILDHLGDVYFTLQDYPKAELSWSRAESIAARSSPPNRRLPDIKRKLAELRKLKPPSSSEPGPRP